MLMAGNNASVAKNAQPAAASATRSDTLARNVACTTPRQAGN